MPGPGFAFGCADESDGSGKGQGGARVGRRVAPERVPGQRIERSRPDAVLLVPPRGIKDIASGDLGAGTVRRGDDQWPLGFAPENRVDALAIDPVVVAAQAVGLSGEVSPGCQLSPLGLRGPAVETDGAQPGQPDEGIGIVQRV
ncbi:MAG: hypothetical protein ACFE0O_10015 [Opitutales bacterium]